MSGACRSRRWNCCASASREHAIDCDWRDGYLGLATNARKGRELQDWAERMEPVYGYVQQRIAPAEMPPLDRQPAFPQRRVRCALGPPASAEVHAGPGTRGGGRRCARARADAGAAAAARADACGCARHRATLRAQHVLLAGNVYLQGVAPALEPRIMPVGTYIACTEALDDALADSLIPSRAAVCDTNFVLDYFRTTNDQRMLYGGRVSYSTVTPTNLAESMRQRMVQHLPATGVGQGGVRLGRLRRHLDEPRPRLRSAARRGRLCCERVLPARLLRARPGSHRPGRQAWWPRPSPATPGGFDTSPASAIGPFPGGDLLRTPALVLGMAWYSHCGTCVA